MTIVARTADHPPTERLDYWRSVLSQAFVPLDAVPIEPAERRLEGSLRHLSLGSMHVAEVRGSAQTVRRSRALIRRRDPGWVKIGLQLSGLGVLYQDDRQAELRPGDLAAYDTTRPYSLMFPGSFRMLVLMCPRAVLRLSPLDLERLTAVRLQGQVGVGAMISPFLARLGETVNQPGPAIDDRAREHLAESVLAMLTAGLLSAGADLGVRADEAVPDALLQRIQTHIEANLPQHDLGPSAIAAVHHISVRHLQNLFERHGWTVGSWIRTRRLEHCRRDLRDPCLRDRSVSAIAARWGLVDAAHFSRGFRAAYGVTPSRYRHAPEPAIPRTDREAADCAVRHKGPAVTDKSESPSASRLTA